MESQKGDVIGYYGEGASFGEMAMLGLGRGGGGDAKDVKKQTCPAPPRVDEHQEGPQNRRTQERLVLGILLKYLKVPIGMKVPNSYWTLPDVVLLELSQMASICAGVEVIGLVAELAPRKVVGSKVARSIPGFRCEVVVQPATGSCPVTEIGHGNPVLKFRGCASGPSLSIYQPRMLVLVT